MEAFIDKLSALAGKIGRDAYASNLTFTVEPCFYKSLMWRNVTGGLFLIHEYIHFWLASRSSCMCKRVSLFEFTLVENHPNEFQSCNYEMVLHLKCSAVKNNNNNKHPGNFVSSIREWVSLSSKDLTLLHIHGIHEHPKSKNDNCKHQGMSELNSFCTKSSSFRPVCLFVFSFWQRFCTHRALTIRTPSVDVWKWIGVLLLWLLKLCVVI